MQLVSQKMHLQSAVIPRFYLHCRLLVFEICILCEFELLKLFDAGIQAAQQLFYWPLWPYHRPVLFGISLNTRHVII